MLQKMRENQYSIVLYTLLVINIFFHSLFLTVPVSLDEGTFFHIVQLISQNHLNPFIDTWGYRPPVMFLIPSIVYTFTAPSLIWPRIEIIFFSSVSLFYLYKLGEYIFSRRVGLSAAILFMCFPLFTVFSHKFQDPIPFTAFFLASLYYFFTQNPMKYLIATSLLVLTKEPGVFLPIFLIIYTKIMTLVDKKTRSLYKISWGTILAPVGIFIIWMIVNKILLGWYLWMPNVSLYNIEILFNTQSIVKELHIILLDNGMWIIFISNSLGLVWISTRHTSIRTEKKYIISFICSLFLAYSFFFLTGYHTKRYYLFLYSLFLLIFCEFLTNWIKNRKVYFFSILCIVGVFSLSQYNEMFFKATAVFDESSLAYLKNIQLVQKVVTTMQRTKPNSFIVAPWYVSDTMRNPYYGYVKQQLKTDDSLNCEKLTEKKIQYWRDQGEKYSQMIYIANSISPLCPQLVGVEFQRFICLDNPTATQDCYAIYASENIVETH